MCIRKDNQSPDSLRLEAVQLKNKAQKFQFSKPAKYIEIMKQVWSLNTQAASLEQ